MNRFQRFMYGRYGMDHLSRFLIGITLLLSIIGSLSKKSIIIYISYLFLFFVLFRMFSKNIQQRAKENMIFVQLFQRIINSFQKLKRTFFGTKTHKYYRCPGCRQTIRVPKGKGKICITCPKCRAEFIRRT